MEQQHSLCYVSSAKETLSSNDLEHLFSVNKRNNTDLNVSGILIYSDGNFLQILEGEEQKIQNLFHKISQDARHNNIIKLIDTSIESRVFDDYEHGFIVITNSKKRMQLESYLHWLKEAELGNVDKVIRIVENFID